MQNYFVLFSVPTATMDKWKAGTSDEEKKKSQEQMMQDWGAWMEAHKDAIVEKGNPLNKVKRLTAAGVADVRNDMVFYMIVKADSHDAAVEMLKGNPHLQMSPDAYVEVIQIPQRGM